MHMELTQTGHVALPNWEDHANIEEQMKYAWYYWLSTFADLDCSQDFHETFNLCLNVRCGHRKIWWKFRSLKNERNKANMIKNSNNNIQKNNNKNKKKYYLGFRIYQECSKNLKWIILFNPHNYILK